MRNEDRMTPEESAEFLRAYAETGDTALRNKVIESHLYIARLIARRFSGRGVETDDLFQIASLSLLKAAERFEAGRGIQFASFATPIMVGEVKNYFRDKSRLIRPPRRSAEIASRIAAAQEKLTQRLARSPRVEEIARETGLSEDDVLEVLEQQSSAPVSLDADLETEENSLLDLLGSEDNGYSSFETRDTIQRALASLPPAEATVIRLRFFENLSQREIAEKTGTSQMSISRTEKRALEHLHSILNTD